LYHLTDLHLEERDHAGPELDKFIGRIKNDESALWVGGGDYGGLIAPGDSRMGDGWAEGVPGERIPQYVTEVVTEKLMPIRDKCVGFGIGNHEWSLMQKFHHGVGFEIAQNLGIPHLYLGLRGWMPVTFRRPKSRQSQTLKIYWHHGWSAGRSKSRKLLQEEREYGAREAHVHLVGHDHQPWINTWYREELYYTSAADQRWRQRWAPVCFMNGGSWTYGQIAPDRKKAAKTPSQMRNEIWVEKKNFRPEPPRSPVLHVEVDFGHRVGKTGQFRPQGFAFTEEMHSPTWTV
jgi:hypothetical protein